MKTCLKELKKEERHLVNFRLTKKEKEIFEKKAELYTNGNLSNLIRFAVLKFNPKKNDLVKVE